MVAESEAVIRRRAIRSKAHRLALLTEHRRLLLDALADVQAAVQQGKDELMALLDAAEAPAERAPVVLLCAGCHLMIPDGDGLPGRRGLYHARCVPPLGALGERHTVQLPLQGEEDGTG